MKTLRWLFLLLVSIGAAAQIPNYPSGVALPAGISPSSGSALPGTCTPGTPLSQTLFFKTTATIGWYQCSAANTWTAWGTGTGTVTGAGTNAQLTAWTGASSLGSITGWTTNATTTLTAGATSILDLSAAGVTTGFKLPSAAGAAPIADSQVAFDTTAHTIVWGSNGATIVPVPNTRTVNGHALSANVTVTAGDVGNSTAQWNANQINGTALIGLGTGILKNTSGTGTPSIAVAGDFPTLNQDTTGNAATATTAANFSGSLSGDVTGTQGATTVSGIRNTTVPALTSGYLHFNGTAFVFDTPGGALCCQVNNHLSVGTGASTIGDSGISVASSHFNGYPYWDVVACGAKGDGTTDDTSAIQTCINNAAAAVNTKGSGTVFFPCGDYKVGSGTNIQAGHGAALDIGFFGISLVGAGSSNYENGSTQGNLTNPGPCATIDQTTNGKFFDGPGGSQQGPTNALTAIGNASHTTTTYQSVENNTTGGSVAAGTYCFFYTYTMPFTASGTPNESTVSPSTCITTTGSTSNPIVYSPDREGNVFGYNVYVCSGSNCASTTAHLVTSSQGQCQGKDANYNPLTHGCWINTNLSITSIPTVTATPPTTSSLVNTINILRSENTFTTAVPGAPTIRSLTLQCATNKCGIGIYNHAGQEMNIEYVAVRGGATAASGAGASAYYQDGDSMPGGANKYANETMIDGLITVGSWTGVRQDAYGSILKLVADINLDSTAGSCTINTNAQDNCPAGVVQMGTGNATIGFLHVDPGGWSNASGIFVDMTNHLNATSSGVGLVANNFRCDKGDGSGTMACVRGLSALHLHIIGMCGMLANDFCLNLDSASITNTIELEPLSTGTGLFSFPANNVVNNGQNSFFYADQFMPAPSTFSQIGTCNTANKGAIRAITDAKCGASACTTTNFGATIAGGSTGIGIAFCDGTNWTFR